MIGTFTSVSIQGLYQILFTIPLAYYTWKAFGRQFRLPASSWWLIAFSLVALISILLNWADVPKPGKNIGKVKYFIMAAFGIFPVGVWLKTVSDRTKRRLQRWLTVSLLIGAGWILWNKLYVGQPRPRPLTETMRYAYGSALLIVLHLGLIAHYESVKSWFSRRWGFLALGALILGIVLMNTRGPQMGFFLSLPFVIWFWKRKLALMAGGVFLVIGLAFTWNYFYGSQQTSKYRILMNKSNNSDTMRLAQWKAAYEAFKEKPVMGWGFGNLYTQMKRIKTEKNLAYPTYEAHAHNVPLEILAGTGIIGFFFFAGWIIAWIVECWRAGGLTQKLMMPFFVTILFLAQFEVILDANNATWISFLYALTLASDKRYQLSVV